MTPTTAHGIHGLHLLQRHDESERFASDEEAQAHVLAALAAADAPAHVYRLFSWAPYEADDTHGYFLGLPSVEQVTKATGLRRHNDQIARMLDRMRTQSFDMQDMEYTADGWRLAIVRLELTQGEN